MAVANNSTWGNYITYGLPAFAFCYRYFSGSYFNITSALAIGSIMYMNSEKVIQLSKYVFNQLKKMKLTNKSLRNEIAILKGTIKGLEESNESNQLTQKAKERVLLQQLESVRGELTRMTAQYHGACTELAKLQIS